MIRPADVVELVTFFKDDGDEAAEKSKELILMLLLYGTSPFSRDSFTPGHITCTATVLSPDRKSFLLVHHRRLDRWLLPGGHVERVDEQIWDTASREALEETGVAIGLERRPSLVGVDVHGIPARRAEPYHLHHDLIFRFQARSETLQPADEIRDVVWARVSDFERFELPVSIRRGVLRAMFGG